MENVGKNEGKLSTKPNRASFLNVNGQYLTTTKEHHFINYIILKTRKSKKYFHSILIFNPFSENKVDIL